MRGFRSIEPALDFRSPSKLHGLDSKNEALRGFLRGEAEGLGCAGSII